MNVYIHIPFCRQKCQYCKFALTPVFDEYKKKKYLYFLHQEIRDFFDTKNIWPLFGKKEDIRNLYFGWGTPSILTIQEVNQIVQIFGKNLGEISFELNPEDVTDEYIKNLLKIGVNRFSMGIQTLNPQSLTTIGRSDVQDIWNALQIFKKYEKSKHLYFRGKRFVLNIDFILGLPHVHDGETLENIKQIFRKFPFVSHTSVYILEKWLYPKTWEKWSISDKQIATNFEKICEFFKKNDWHHYEVSNFARPGDECAHNSGYWSHTETIGFGLSASGLQKTENPKKPYVRYTRSDSFSGYYKKEFAVWEVLSPEQIMLEDFLFRIRTDGVEIQKFEKLLNIEKIWKFVHDGFLISDEKKFALTERWYPLIDKIIDEIIL